uniref:Uncharacterized protein n=1 Tax=Trichogramma kaykai TaxID=54128 RepID=A0ABD2WVZ0_9HYME
MRDHFRNLAYRRETPPRRVVRAYAGERRKLTAYKCHYARCRCSYICIASERTWLVKEEPNDAWTGAGDDDGFDSVDSCEVKNFGAFTFHNSLLRSKDTWPDAGGHRIFDAVDSCEVKNFRTLTFYEQSPLIDSKITLTINFSNPTESRVFS